MLAWAEGSVLGADMSGGRTFTILSISGCNSNGTELTSQLAKTPLSRFGQKKTSVPGAELGETPVYLDTMRLTGFAPGTTSLTKKQPGDHHLD